MAAAFVETSRRVRVVLSLGAAALALLLATLAVDVATDLDRAGDLAHRWGGALAAALSAAAVILRVVAVERERRAWVPLAAGLTSFTLGSVLWEALWWGRPDAPIPSPADVLWLAFFPAACLTIAMLVRRSFVRAPTSMWLDGLLAALAFAALGIALIYGPIVGRTTGSAIAIGSQVAYPLGDLVLIALVLGVVAMTGWRPGVRWLTIGAAMICWFAADTANLSRVAAGGGLADGTPDVFWVAGLGLLGAAAWQRPSEPEGSGGEGLRMLLVPAIFSGLALTLLVLDRFSPTNDISAVLALAAVAIALARTTLTLREVQLLASARHESLTDELTGLPSRRLFHRRLDAALREADAEAVPLGLLIFDLDRFKDLNDTLGHGAGDTVLQLVGGRLRDALGRGPLLARLGGDEFAVLLPAGHGREAAMAVGETVIEAISRPFEVDGLELDIGASVGVAVFPDHATEDGELMRRADVAMYLAKEAGGGVALYDPARDLHTRDRLALGRQLRAGLERDELVIYYQPKVDPQLGRVLGVEAMVRWQHPGHGLMLPPDFLPLASRSGLMPVVTRRVLDAALEQLSRWRADGLDLTTAVNLAVSDLIDPDLPADVARLLARHDVPPACLSLEVTEDGVVADPEGAIETLDAIARLGVRIALDDFGTGWSSLAHLRRMPVDELKMDRSFVSSMAHDEDDAAIVRTTLDLARSLRLRVVAEGVEDDQTWRLLADLGCDAIQGYVLGRPLPGQQLGAWLAARRDGSVARCRVPGQDAPVTQPSRFRM